jgi:hypothetical protein
VRPGGEPFEEATLIFGLEGGVEAGLQRPLGGRVGRAEAAERRRWRSRGNIWQNRENRAEGQGDDEERMDEAHEEDPSG